MTQDRDTYVRYAREFIERTGSTDNIKQFLLYCNLQNNLSWSKQNFENIYKNFCQNSSNRGNASQQSSNQSTDHGQATQPDSSNGGNTGQQPNQPATPPQNINIYVQDPRSSRWDFLELFLLQYWINSFFSKPNHTTNTTHINYNTNINNGNTSNEDEQQKSADDRKLLALGIAALVFIIIFHVSVWYSYNHSKKNARMEKQIDYLDNDLKMFRNIEFVGCAVSLIALIACAVYPVLPAWGLIALGVNALVCAVGGLAFQMKHEKESENIKNAKSVVDQYLENITTQPPSYAEATASAPLLC